MIFTRRNADRLWRIVATSLPAVHAYSIMLRQRTQKAKGRGNQLTRLVARDEARHVAFGLLCLYAAPGSDTSSVPESAFWHSAQPARKLTRQAVRR
jgi:hypothetical protein